MKKFTNIFKIGGFLALAFTFTFCSSVRTASSTVDQGNASSMTNQGLGSPNTVETNEVSIPLATYLRRVPGVQVSQLGGTVIVRIRGLNSINNGDPLFVVDGIPIGNSYNQAASIVPVTDIRYVTVLKDVASTSMYGMRGSNGVIVIKTKR